MDGQDEFFRTLIALDNGERVYDTANGMIVCRNGQRRESVELMQRMLLSRETVAFAPELHALRPAWAFPPGVEFHRVVEFRNETATEPPDPAAHLLTGEAVTDRTAILYVG